MQALHDIDSGADYYCGFSEEFQRQRREHIRVSKVEALRKQEEERAREYMRAYSMPEFARAIVFAKAEEYGVSPSDIIAGRRMKEVVAARHAAVYEVKKEKRHLSASKIGKWFGGRDHTFVFYALAKHAELAGVPNIGGYDLVKRRMTHAIWFDKIRNHPNNVFAREARLTKREEAILAQARAIMERRTAQER